MRYARSTHTAGRSAGIAGEYFVAAELSRRGYIASLTLWRARGVDILAQFANDSPRLRKRDPALRRIATGHRSARPINEIHASSNSIDRQYGAAACRRRRTAVTLLSARELCHCHDRPGSPLRDRDQEHRCPRPGYRKPGYSRAGRRRDGRDGSSRKQQCTHRRRS
ncbi:MAG: hypothetical protein DMF57_16130 [Acidobacteria bacterium]|nr:MAG: hypothetical protein DMF57_16130 [Acidobacteriota bacterium]